MFSGASIAAMTVCGLLCIIIPAAALIFLKIKCRDVKISSFFIGAAVFIVFALILEQLLHTVMLPVVSGSTAAYVLYGALAAGVFEETGRFAAFRTVMKGRNDPKDAVMYGLGHGGTEAILIAGLSLLGSAVTAAMTNSMGIDAVAELSASGNAETEQLVRTQLEMMAANGAGIYMLSLFERIMAMTFHTAVSVMVFEAARVRGRTWLFPVCILIHALLDVPAALYQRQALSLYAVYPIIAVFTAVTVFFAIRSYRKTAAYMETEE